MKYKNLLQKALKTKKLYFIYEILVCDFKKPKVHIFPSDLTNFQQFITHSTLTEGHFH